MNSGDLLISNRDGAFEVTVSGRANFEYAVPLRDIARKPEMIRSIKIDLSACQAMDSTFMGVLTMLSVALRRTQITVELCNASEHLVASLRGLGVQKLFKFTTANLTQGNPGAATGKAVSQLDLAETVAEAHKELAAENSANAEKFAAVIQYAEEDVKKLRSDGKN
ncbi:MAG: STAS domain-containing protein [Victivallaceae bacterium]|nr:STAS domain-containing protein [Victivallaceae bacterium]